MSRLYEIKPAVSVIVPAYNAERTVEATLASAFAQSIRDLEVIAVDDGSMDATSKLLRDMAARDRRLRVIHQRNGGVSVARNAGILAAKADVLAFLDADDIWPADHVATHLGRIVQPPGGLDVSFSGARFVDTSGRVIGAANPDISGLTADRLLQTNPTTTTSTWVVRRSAFDAAGLFDVALRHCEDQEWLVRAALAGLRIEGTTATVVDYRVSTSGLAADLDRMHAGFHAMLAAIGERAPDVVARSGQAAAAAQELYLSRQSVRLGLGRRRAWRHVARALAVDPHGVWRSPRQTVGAMARVLVGRGGVT